ncbi:SET domain-containing protein [Nocardia brasiliensis]|uniref:SET domain-containing protein n=1 Tax=Nocardia brasiliensis TaxID=37326 RepID=UPI002456941D|nr:SET domain-containing protein [Nocardia brasiliensis]
MLELRPSLRDGLGVFATQSIPGGTMLAHYDETNTMTLNARQYDVLSRSTSNSGFLDLFLHFGIYDQTTDTLVVALDDGRFTNHSSNPNSGPAGDPGTWVALRDIEAGEEVVEDYRGYGRCPWAPMWYPQG